LKYLRIVSIALVLLVILACAALAASNAPFFFVQIADTQLGFTTGNKDLTVEIDHFKQAVAHINRLKPAFVIVSGDMTHATHDPKQIREFWKIAREISPSIPLHLVPGNHDVGKATAEDIRSYEKLFGEDHYGFSVNGTSFIVLDSCLLRDGADTTLRDAQRKWFESELTAAEASKAAHIFVCTHHPFFLTKPDEADKYQNVPLAQRTDYLDLMTRCGVDYAISGHLHHDQTAKYNGLTLTTCEPLSKSVAKPPVVGFRIWRVYKDRIETQFYPLDKVPESLKL
jgi:serine/threonine-protein phosphatase CPPED1